jgi:hypothetical protein
MVSRTVCVGYYGVLSSQENGSVVNSTCWALPAESFSGLNPIFYFLNL